jgi:hypothetical protein
MMKTLAAFIAGLITALGLAAGAAVTTITTTAPEDARIVAAFGSYLALGRNATQAEVKGAIVTFVKGVVFNYEAEVAKASATQGVTQINPS